MTSESAIRRPNWLRSALVEGRFCCTAELVLGRDHEVAEAETFVREAAENPEGIKIISVTDLPGGNPALPPEAFASFILEKNLTPVAHLSGKDGNRAAIEARLHTFARLGVENILALTGDAQKEGFAGKPKPVYDLDSVLILRLLHAAREGIQYNLAGRDVCSSPFDFLAGAVVNPYKVGEPDQMMQFYKLRLKIAAGAKFIITQLGFNLRKLYELKQYLFLEGLGRVPVLANVYVPTAKIARLMQSGELAGCVVSDELIRRLESEKKLERLERAAHMVAAVRELGFAGAHIGGFGLTHRDFMTMLERAVAVGRDWRRRIDELVFPYPNEFYLLPRGVDGLSNPNLGYQLSRVSPRPTWTQRMSRLAHRHLIASESHVARFFASRLKAEGGGDSWRRGLWARLLSPSVLYRKATLGCVDCGDCIQEHLNYAGCSMASCYKELRNGPCGGSRVDGACEARPEQPCVWNRVYTGALAVGDDPSKFARTLIPPRDWSLDGTNSLANRLAGRDNLGKRIELPGGVSKERAERKAA